MKKNSLLALIVIGAVCITTGCGVLGKPEAIEDEWKIAEEKALTLADGTALNLWQRRFSTHNSYRLADGTEILTEEVPFGPENVHTGGRESFQNLPEETRKAISAYYEEQGFLYDRQDAAQKAYERYLQRKAEGEPFYGYYVGQSTSLCASNERVVYFLTSVTEPLDVQQVAEHQVGAAFDRATGEVISPWDLFTVSEEEAKAFIVEQFSEEDGAVRQEMQEKLLAEYLVFQPDALSVFFPLGVISSFEYSSGTGIRYEDMEGILQPWAVPDPMGS